MGYGILRLVPHTFPHSIQRGFATMCSSQFVRFFCVGGNFLLVRFHLLDADILMLGMKMPKKYVSGPFWSLICVALFCNTVFVLVRLQCVNLLVVFLNMYKL